MTASRKWWAALGLLTLWLAVPLARGAGFEDPQRVPALSNATASKSPLIGVSRVGNRVVAVGQRGVVVVSEDGGKTWVQGKVPVRTDLLAVHFPSALNGWAVGHGGVVIHSRDGGLTWAKQLDGKQASQRVLDYYANVPEGTGQIDGPGYIKREKVLVGFGGTQPFMGVYFETDLRGYVVGTFSRILRTEDGGKTWEPLNHRVDNPKEQHFYSIAAGPAGLYLVGEAGNVWRYDKDADHFALRPTGYAGTLFGIVVGDKALLAHGMRGSVYRSTNQGDSWQRIDMGSHAGISGGAQLEDGRIVLVNLAGSAYFSSDAGESFKSFRAPGAMSYFGVVPFDAKRLALVGAEGVRLRELSDLQTVLAAAPAATSTQERGAQ